MMITEKNIDSFLKNEMDEELGRWITSNKPYLINVIQPDEYQHLKHCIKSMVADLFNKYEAGSFSRAVLENNLSETIGQADDINKIYLSVYMMFLYNCVPGDMVRKRRLQV